MKYLNDYDAYPEGENSGNYFPFTADNSYKGKPITVKRTSGGTSEKTATDLNWVLRLTDGTDTTYEISSEGNIIAVLDWLGATLAKE